MTDGPAELLLVDGHLVVSAVSGPAVPAAVAVRGGVIVAIGAAALELRGPRTQVLPVAGATVIPGLVDGHSHPVMGLDLAESADLSGCRTLAQLSAVLAGHAASFPPGAFLVGSGLDPNVFGAAAVDNDVIGRAVDGRPALVHLFDGHAAVATDAALAAAGITGAMRLPGGAGIAVDGDGAPTGLLLEEAAIDLVARLIPPATRAVRLARLRDLLSAMAATGLTGAHVMDAKGDAAALFAALDEHDELALRLRVAPWCRPGDSVAKLLDLQGAGGRMWRVAGVKMFLDGTIDGGTAWLSAPDTLGGSTAPGWEPADFQHRLAALDRADVPVAVHAIGDRAVQFVLDTVESLPRRPGGPRHRIEHAETMPDTLVHRFGRLGVAASMQPRHATDYTRADGTDNWSRRLGPVRAARGWRCADVVRAGGTVILGSDWPVAPFDARLTLAAAIARRPPENPAGPPVQPEQALTPIQALHACTAAPAWVSRTHSGRIEVGAAADLTILAADPRQVPSAELGDLEVLQTISGGRPRLPPR